MTRKEASVKTRNLKNKQKDEAVIKENDENILSKEAEISMEKITYNLK